MATLDTVAAPSWTQSGRGAAPPRASQGMSLKARLAWMLGVSVMLICLLSVFVLFHQRSIMMEDRTQMTRNLVEAAFHVVENYEALAASGKLSEAEAKSRAAHLIGKMRYDAKEYFFALDRNFVFTAHGVKPELIGKPFAGKDADGNDLVTLFRAALQEGNGQGFAHYRWEKPGHDKPQPKISYLMQTPGWGWVLGTGLYVDDVDHAFYEQLALLTGGVVIALAILGGIGMVITRGVLRQLGGEPGDTAAIVQRIADGYLDTDVPVRKGDEHSLLASVAHMQTRLRTLVQEIAENAGRLAEMSTALNQNAEAVAHGSDQQSTAAASMAASVEELTVSVNHIADHAQDARRMAQQSDELSEEGRQVIAQAVGEMHRINESVDVTAETLAELATKTQTISSIMQVIKDIADQTNLLALNAAIEAARAGEMGRGFAVVADEVRKLSERTGQATQEIAVMIREIQASSDSSHANMEQAVSRVKSGLALAEQGGEAIRRIRDSAQGVVGVINDISHALKEQGVASQEIARHVEDIALSASQNADAAKVSSQSTVQLKEVASTMHQHVERFHL